MLSDPVLDQLAAAADRHAASGRPDLAFPGFEEVLRRDPSHALANRGLGLLHFQAGRPTQGIAHMERAAAAAPQNAELCFLLGSMLASQNLLDRAARALRRAAELNPRFAPIRGILGTCYLQMRDLDSAEACYREALALDPRYAEVRSNLGSVLQGTGRQSEAVELLRQAVRDTPSHPALATAYCSSLNYADGIDPGEMRAAAEHYGRLLMSLPGGPPAAAWPNTPDPAKRLRVAIVSPDLFDHSVAYFVRPVLEHRDPGAVEYFCFHTGPMQDWMSRHLRAASAGWRDMSRANDAQLLEAVRRDQPDIVLELAGHTNNSRLIALRWRGGPVQATAIGYPNTTGVPTIDYRLVDSLTDPPGPADALATEKLVRLDPCFLCYSPPAPDHTPPPVAPPSVRNGFITFGSFNSINKVTPGTVSLWASVLRGVPRSRLLVKTGGLSAQSARHHLAGLLAGAGVPADRFDLMERVRDKRDHLETYNRIDISLDTSPYNGTTTTCESLFMGVPVVSLATTLHAGRVGLSVLTAAGHPGLVARSPEQFLRIAVSLASDGPRLADLRSGLRAGLAASALCDGPAYARRFEAALRGMWGAYCAGHTGGPR